MEGEIMQTSQILHRVWILGIKSWKSLWHTRPFVLILVICSAHMWHMHFFFPRILLCSESLWPWDVVLECGEVIVKAWDITWYTNWKWYPLWPQWSPYPTVHVHIKWHNTFITTSSTLPGWRSPKQCSIKVPSENSSHTYKCTGRIHSRALFPRAASVLVWESGVTFLVIPQS